MAQVGNYLIQSDFRWTLQDDTMKGATTFPRLNYVFSSSDFNGIWCFPKATPTNINLFPPKIQTPQAAMHIHTYERYH